MTLPKNIRPLKPEDREQWGVLWRGYQEYYEADLSTDTDALFARILENRDYGPFCLVFENEEGKLLGLTQYLLHDSTWSPKPRCYLNDLYSLPEARGMGVGRALIEAVSEDAKSKGVEDVYWLTQDFNHTARKLYDKVAKKTPFIKYVR